MFTFMICMDNRMLQHAEPVNSSGCCQDLTLQYNTMKNLHSKTDKHTVSLI